MTSMASTIALLTDFGRAGPYVGILKGVILSRCPDSRVLDLTHAIPPGDIRLGAFYLMVSASYFPAGTIFVCVVNPGVGSDRRIVWAKNKTHQFLAPDNGLLSWVESRNPFEEIREVTNQQLFNEHVSHTFQGRDIFAPVAAGLAKGIAPASIGAKISAIKGLPFPEPKIAEGKVRGVVLAIDRFGNAITNITPEILQPGAEFRFKGKTLGELKSHYSRVKPGAPLVVTGSFGFLELAVRNDSFAKKFDAQVEDPVEVHLP